jgi:hypothetical protein
MLLDAQRLRDISAHQPGSLSAYHERELRRLAAGIQDNSGDVPAFVSFVLENICGFIAESGTWQRGNSVPAEWGRIAVTGETVKPRQLWRGGTAGLLPVFVVEKEKKIGIGRGRRITSQVLQWLRASSEKLALITNGHQWRLVFAGLDFDAWCEWELELWFEEGALSPQVMALRTLLSPVLWTPARKGAASPLLQAILDSRKGQAELSAVLGERVREAVELLVQGHGEALREHCAGVEPADIYRAAVRMVMRMVVVLFAESRELLPRDNSLYHGSYGLTGLLEELEKVAARGGNRLARSWNAYPRILSLFRLVHQGSHHPAIPVPAYGGELFAPGDIAEEGLSKALAVFETASYDRELLPDREVYRILELITRTKIKIRQGRSSTWVPAPVDFSDLSSEYIGILYEGLLDFELKTAPAGDPVVFLAVGNQPALPLSRLEAMDDAALKNLLENMKDTSSKDEEDAGEEDEAQEDSPEQQAANEGDETEPEPQEVTEEPGDERHTTRTRAEVWARRAVEVGKLVNKPRGAMTPEKRLRYEESVASKARLLVTRVILPGEWYLVRWGGTRKGSGTFYTRPGLAVPTVHRTLRPLAYNPPAGANGKPDCEAPAAKWTPKKPEEILALKVCDPGCGSGSFDVAALRFLTGAVYDALYYHGRLAGDSGRPLDEILGLIAPGTADDDLKAIRLPRRPEDDDFEKTTKAVLRRYVVERCIYGVDLDPLAVELCRLALWVETMDKTLPFSFLDHKVKCGNSLVGAWFDQFQHYPAMAWKNRDGGDKGHTNGVHFEKETRTKAIKAFVKDVLTPDLLNAIPGGLPLFTPPATTPQGVHDKSLALLDRLHNMPVQDAAQRSRLYRSELLGSPEYRSLKEAMDLWCACWFWPTDELDKAPLPTTFANPSADTRTVAARIVGQKTFFHWELEFPDVYRTEVSGFDAMLGNPPWDIAKPNSKEFFSNIDPLYRSYGKQEALRYQTDYFGNETVERGWLDYSADFRAQSNYLAYAASPYGDPVENQSSGDRFTIARGRNNDVLHDRWRTERKKSRGYADAIHPFRHQGSADINLYKTFLEQAHSLLRLNGRMAFIVPSGLYSDHGTGGLRTLFLDKCQWEWLFGFENREKVFEIDSRFKFNPVIIQKSGSTAAIKTAFMRRKLEDWEQAEELVTLYSRKQVERFSPRSKAILEIQSARDLEILEKIYSNSVLLGDEGPDGWGIKYATEFHMTNDSKLFPPRPKWEEQGYRPDEYSRWLKGDWRPINELWAELGVKPLAEGEKCCAQPPYDTLPILRADIPAGIVLSRRADAWIRESRIDDLAQPLYQGLMFYDRRLNVAAHVSGAGHHAKWQKIALSNSPIVPQFLMRQDDYNSNTRAAHGLKLALRSLSNSTNERTIISALLPDLPAGHSINFMQPREGDIASANLFGITSSLTFDWLMRMRIVGTNVTWNFLTESSVPGPVIRATLIGSISKLALTNCTTSPAALMLGTKGACKWALMSHERLRLDAELDAIVAATYGMDFNDLHHILLNTDWPISNVEKDGNVDPKGFWRVDKDKDPELRHTVLTMIAFHDLEENIRACDGDRDRGIEAFLEQNNGEGWMLPLTLRLADYGLGHDERAKEHQPVASRLGPRFYDWQLAQSPEESWKECHLHARNLLGEDGYKKLLEEIEAEKRGEKPPTEEKKADMVKEDTPGYQPKLL